MRSVLRICPSYHYFSSTNNNNNNSTINNNINNNQQQQQQTDTIKYYYEATDLEHFTVYENNIRENGKTFQCDYIYDNHTSQLDIFINEIVPYIEKVLNGIDCNILLFGNDYSGKRYTLEGIKDSPGIFYKTIEYLFNKKIELNNLFKIYFNSVMINKEIIYDNLSLELLNSSENNQLRLKDDKKKGIIIEGISNIEIKDLNQALHLFYEVNNKFYKINNLNKHLILTLRIVINNKLDTILNFISIGNINPLQLDDINSNLWINNLSNCLNCLQNNLPSIPFHKSKFTLLLRDTLLNLKETLILCNLSPVIENYKFVIQNLNICHQLKNILSLQQIKNKELKESMIKESRKEEMNDEIKVTYIENTNEIALQKKELEINSLKEENKYLNEKVLQIESQLKKLTELQEFQSKQIQAISPLQKKKSTRINNSINSNNVNNTSIESNSLNSNELDRYREVMESMIIKLKKQMKEVEEENLNLKKEISKMDILHKKNISKLLNNYKTSTKQVEDLQKENEELKEKFEKIKKEKRTINLEKKEKEKKLEMEINLLKEALSVALQQARHVTNN
ncbi:hypothetical protein ABK040_010515 [Willaertia magna]